MEKELAWRKSLREVADNPDFIFIEMEGLKKELETKDDPDISYLKEKHRHIGQWIDEIEKFHFKKLRKEVV
jgi:hypothetical protein